MKKTKNKTQFAISYGDSEPRNFFQKFRTRSHKQQAPSNRQQAGGWAHRQQASACQDKNKFDIMGFSGTFSYDSAGPTMSQQNCLLHTSRARPWSFRRWTHFTRAHQSLVPAQRLAPLADLYQAQRDKASKTESSSPEIENRKATSDRRQALSVKRQATSFPTFR